MEGVIKGSISTLLRGLDGVVNAEEILIGKPIKNLEGKQIGVINRVDVEKDIWYGTCDLSDLPANISIPNGLYAASGSSFEITRTIDIKEGVG